MGSSTTKVVVVAPKRRKQGSNPKSFRFGGKQRHGHSRAAYFAQAPARIAANKARRIKKEQKKQEKRRRKLGQLVVA